MGKLLAIIAAMMLAAGACHAGDINPGLPVIVLPGASQIGLVSGSTVYPYIPVLPTITQSSVTVTAAQSVQLFAADGNRKNFEIYSLPTNTDFVIGKWGGPAVSTDTIIIGPGQTYTPGVSISTLTFNLISNTGSQIVRGNSYAP